VEEMDAELALILSIAAIIFDDLESTSTQKKKCIEIINKLVEREKLETVRSLPHRAFCHRVDDATCSLSHHTSPPLHSSTH
jgi:hypothetical protein